MKLSQKSLDQIEKIINDAKVILIIQADNPDGDSLASSLALEKILHDMGKEPIMYCGVNMPSYLKYLEGWDRVERELPHKFDASIIVDNSSLSLLENIDKAGQRNWLATKPCLVLDHHDKVSDEIPFADVIVNQPAMSSTGELIYQLCHEFSWKIDVQTGTFLLSSILSDSQGLTNQLATVDTYKTVTELIKLGVNRPELEEKRRAASKMHPKIFRYKAKLIEKTELVLDGKLAIIEIPEIELIEYSPLYNPGPLIQPDTLQTEGVKISIVFKVYKDKKITASVRSNNNYPIANKLASEFGGGGHEYAAGFKITDGHPIKDIRNECIKSVEKLLKILG